MMRDQFAGLAYVWHLHILFGGALLFGAVLLLVWLAKEGKKETVMKVIWVTLVVGILGLFLTSPWSGRYWGMMHGVRYTESGMMK